MEGMVTPPYWLGTSNHLHEGLCLAQLKQCCTGQRPLSSKRGTNTIYCATWNAQHQYILPLCRYSMIREQRLYHYCKWNTLNFNTAHVVDLTMLHLTAFIWLHASSHADGELTESVKGGRMLRKRLSTSKEGEGDYSHWKVVNYASPQFSPYNYERNQIM